MKKEHRLNRPSTSKWTHPLIALVVLGLLLAAGMAFANNGNSANSQSEGEKANDENAASARAKETSTQTQAKTASLAPRKQKAPVFTEPPAAGWRIHIDPDTGQRLSRAPAGGGIQGLSAETRRALSTSHAGLFEELMPDGSYRLNLQGRFRGLSSATVAADGSIQVTHKAPSRTEAQAEPSTTAAAESSSSSDAEEVRNDR